MLRIKFPEKTGLREASRFMSDTLGYGAIMEGREAAYIIINALTAPSALQETSSRDQLFDQLPHHCLFSPPPCNVRDGLFF